MTFSVVVGFILVGNAILYGFRKVVKRILELEARVAELEGKK